MSVSARVVGIIRHPRQTLQEVASHPTWVSLLVGLTLATAAAGALVSATEVGQLALVDQWERTVLAFGRAGRRRPLRRAAGVEPAGPGRGGRERGCGRPGRGGWRSRCWPSGGCGAGRRPRRCRIRRCWPSWSTPASFSRSGARRGAPGVRPRDHGQRHDRGLVVFGIRRGVAVARFLGAIDLFTVWWAVVLGIGLAVLSGRRARTCAAWLVSVHRGGPDCRGSDGRLA